MQQTWNDPNLNIYREVSDAIRRNLVDMLTSYIDETVNMGCDFSEVFHCAYLREAFLSKYVDEYTDPADVRRHRAIVKWLGVEQANKRTNKRLLETDPLFNGIGHGHQVLLKAAKLIRRVLGELPEDLLSRGSFSGGATTSTKRGVGTIARKFTGFKDVTPQAWSSLVLEVPKFETWAFYDPGLLSPRFVKGNVLFTVPKTTVIDRVACKEPDWNVFAQKSVGDYIRKRLHKKAGINLNDQSINRELARKGSISRKLATIDLSSASDSLTTSLVFLLLPDEWFRLLDSLRSPKTFIDGASHSNEMFSSMGNGFTFEVESLIFWALAKTVSSITRTKGEVSVYGDDIIIPTGCAGVYIKLLSWCGFTTNAKKTFVKGPFRESCGGHYYGGSDVTPFYLRRPISDVSDLILFLNQYRRWLIVTEMDTVENGYNTKNRFVRFWYNLAAFVPKALWGGYDLNSRVQLCSPHPQRCELLRTTRRWARLETELGIGLYLTRLSQLDRVSFPRDTDIDASSLTTQGKWVIRRCKFEPAVFGIVKPMFCIEHGTDYWSRQ